MKNVQLIYSGRIKKIRAAVNVTNEILNDPDFYKTIMAYRKFDNSSLSPAVIARLMQESDHQINVGVNYFMNFPRRTSYDRITVCRWTFSSHIPIAVNALIYETVRAIDSLYDILNKKEVRENQNQTASWVIGAIAEVMVNEKELVEEEVL